MEDNKLRARARMLRRSERDHELPMLIRVLSVATLSVMATALVAYAEPIDPAQAIAQKFAEEGDEQKPAKKPAPIAAPKKIAANPKKVAPKEPGADYEADMLERARAEELDRQKEEARQAEIKPDAPTPPPPVTPSVEKAPATPTATPSVTQDPTPPPATPLAAQAPSPPPAPAALAVMQPPASAPTPAVSPPAPVTPPAVQAPDPAPQIAALPPKPVSEPPAVSHDAASPIPTIPTTVLLVLDTSTPLGFKPDPIICIEDRCWLSNGIGAPARAMPRTQAVALPTTDEATADSCSGKSACVYRGVAIDPTTRLEVIEVGEGHGASAGAFTVAPDTSCREDHSTLVCDNGLATQNFRIWVVPEATADVAGAASLEDAVAEGLPQTDAQSNNDK
jgi:hypothetical protein